MTAGEALAAVLDEIDSGPSMRGVHADHAPAILAALDAAGWCVVPKVATEEMAYGGTVAIIGDEASHIAEAKAREVWAAMLAARPR